MTQILGIDYGTKRIGLAKSDEAGWLAHGLGFVAGPKDGGEIQEIIELIRAENIGTVVIGHPVNMDGSVGPKAREAEAFAESLRQAAQVEVKLWDERLTSKEAQRYLIATNMSRTKRKKKVDQLAAQIMLQGYLDAQRK
ncbi:MAG: Holliday junction resolvase RuvX [Candidatus Omnitrophica bacterium]|nr:Holliday junction resolvase RuvX [Candidatus Omnitrophota bacterium]